MRVDRAWVVFDTKHSTWLADVEKNTWKAMPSWTNRFDEAKIYSDKYQAQWAAYLASNDAEVGSLQLQQVEAIWTVKSRERYIADEVSTR